MKRRLRHPIRAIREPFGTAGLIVACIALVAALGGTAFAAAKLNSTQKKEVEKIAKKFAGKPGAPGATGPAGTNGKDGAAGTNGTNGTNGESVTVTTIASPGCEGRAGAKFKNATGEAKACNGKEGSPWTAGGTLPSGKTETGTWATTVGEIEGGFFGSFGYLPITTSFDIPLASPLSTTGCETAQSATCQVHLIAENGKEVIRNSESHPEEVTQRTPAPCPGSAAAPKAESGNLCVYFQEGEGAIAAWGPILSTSGGVVFRLVGKTPGEIAYGSLAVTAE